MADTIKDKLMNQYIDECEGIEKYTEIHKMLIEENCDPKYGAMIKAIVKDEYQHQKELFHILNDMGAFIPEGIKSAMSKADKAYDGIK